MLHSDMNLRLLLPFHPAKFLNFISFSCFPLSLFVEPSDGIDRAWELLTDTDVSYSRLLVAISKHTP